MIIGITGLIIVGIIIGIMQPGAQAQVSFSGISFDLVIVYLIATTQDPTLRTVLILLFLLGYFSSSE